MSQILDFYVGNSGNPDISTIATEYLLNDTLGKNLIKKDKIKDIDGMDMESRLSGKIIPGMIFTFIYDHEKNRDIIEDLNMGDNFPIVLCCGLNKTKRIIDGRPYTSLCIDGINLNLLDKKSRLKLLDCIHNFNINFYEHDIYNATKNNTIAINKNLASKFQNSNFLKALSKATNINLLDCYRKYDITKCNNIRLIEYNLWKYIPFYNPKRYLINLTGEQIDQINALLNAQ